MFAILLAVAAAPSFAAAGPAFDPRLHKSEIGGRPAEVLVLGTTHLSGLPPSTDPRIFQPLIDKLARFSPQIITVEALSGEECDTLQRFKSVHGADTWETYCKPLNENYTIAAALAARLGLERIYAVDDHTADTALDNNSPEGKAYGNAVQAAWKHEPPPAIRGQRTGSRKIFEPAPTCSRSIG